VVTAVRNWFRSEGRSALTAGLILGFIFGLVYAVSILRGAYDPWLAARRWSAIYPVVEGAWWGLTFLALAAVVGVTRGLVDRLTRRHVVCHPAIVYGFLATIVVVAMMRLDWLESALYAAPLGWRGALLSALAVVVALSRLRPPVPQGPSGPNRLRASAAGLSAIGVVMIGVVGVSTAASRAKNEGAARADGRRPNIVLITIDALRADALGCLSEEAPPTPQIDKLASRGIVFRKAYVQATWTLGSFSSMMTSLYPFEAGTAAGTKTPGGLSALMEAPPTAAELLSETGYHTVAQLTNPYLTDLFGAIRGFREVRHSLAPRPYFQRPVLRLRKALRDAQAGDGAEVMTRGAEAWLDEGRREPFFLWVHYLDVHEPYVPPGTTTSVYRALLRVAEDGGPGEKAEARKRLRELYDAEVTYCDHYVGRLLAALEERGLADRSVVILTADHGEAFWEHGVRGHHRHLPGGEKMYEHDEVLRVPLIMALPDGRDAGTVIDEPVRMLDLMPTILALAGVEIPEHVRGRPLLEWLAQGQSGAQQDAAVSEGRPTRWPEGTERAGAARGAKDRELPPRIKRELEALGYL
jgi:arylsulfatase A-like enzyme